MKSTAKPKHLTSLQHRRSRIATAVCSDVTVRSPLDVVTQIGRSRIATANRGNAPDQFVIENIRYANARTQRHRNRCVEAVRRFAHHLK